MRHGRWVGALLLGCVLVLAGMGAHTAVAAAAAEPVASEPESEDAARQAGAGGEAADPEQRAGSPSREFPPEIEKLLSEPSSADDYGTTENCIPVRSVRDTKILDDRHIVFRLPGQQLYLVRFQHRCMQLRRDSTLIMEPRGNRLCRLDTVRASNSFGVVNLGPPCSIPGFIEVTAEQVALLEDTLAAQRKRGREPKDETEDLPEPPPIGHELEDGGPR